MPLFIRQYSKTGPKRLTNYEPPLQFVLIRIIGNDLPPRHKPGQCLRNLRFILKNESALTGCIKRWIVNRIVDRETERAIIALLDEYQQKYVQIEFQPEEYAQLPALRDIHDFQSPTLWSTHDEARRVLFGNARAQINYAIPINAARNRALADGRALADWIMPFDGNVFIPAAAWRSIETYLARHRGRRYLVVPMARCSQADDVLDPNFRPTAYGEPQVMFRKDASVGFNESIPYGRRDKVELLWRLGVGGPWDRWRDDPWDPPRPRVTVAKREVAAAGWAIRLSSGQDEMERGRGADRVRTLAREAGMLRLIKLLDAQAMNMRLQEY